MRSSKGQVAVVVLAGFLWEFIPRVFAIEVYVLPPLSRVLGELVSTPGLFAKHLANTAAEAATGALLAVLTGAGLALSMARHPGLGSALNPFIVAANTVPVVAIAPLITIWLGHGFWSKAVVAAFLSFFPLVATYYKNLVEIDSAYRDLFVALGASDSQLFWRYSVPNALSSLLVGAKVSATLAVVGAVVAEFMGASAGLGFGMLQAVYALNTARLFAFVILSVITGLAFFGAGQALEFHFSRKMYGASITRVGR